MRATENDVKWIGNGSKCHQLKVRINLCQQDNVEKMASPVDPKGSSINYLIKKSQ